MDFHSRRDQALQLLAEADVSPGTYAPPLLKLLWRCGLKVRPPHFMGFAAAALLWGAWFSVPWGAFMWMMVWSRQHTDVRLALAAAGGAGLFFGLSLAGYYARQRRKLGLPRWESLA
jgi:hypothetical protein